MALTKCPECGKEVSTLASTCPHCGYPLKGNGQTEKPVSYETKIVNIRCWGRSADSLNSKLKPYISAGWTVVSFTEDTWRGGILSPVYKVILRRAKK